MDGSAATPWYRPEDLVEAGFEPKPITLSDEEDEPGDDMPSQGTDMRGLLKALHSVK